MIKIRRNAFETNSSSVHSLAISTDGLEKCKLRIHKDGFIYTDYGSFGKNYNLYRDQSEKLSYLATCAYYIEDDDYDVKNVNNSYFWQRISNAIVKYVPECIGVKILGKEEAYIDHQSIPGYDGINFVDTYDEDAIINFIFNKNIWLKTESD